MSRRRLQALRNLAERPGTEAEGEVARAALARLEERRKNPTEEDRWASFESYLKTGSDDDLRDACVRTCDCGGALRYGEKCSNEEQHFRIRVQKTQMFSKGARVYYNRWAYAANCPGIVVGYSKSWNLLRVQFDHLKNPRSIPVYGSMGWHLSTEPLTAGERRHLREGMEEQDAFQAAIDRDGRYDAIVRAMKGDFGESIRDSMIRVWRDEPNLATEYARMENLA